MASDPPLLQELNDEIIADIESEFSITIPLFGKNSFRNLSAVQAGKLWIYYKKIGFLQKNIFADTADSEAVGGTLERFGRIKLGRNPFPALAGQYGVLVTGDVGQTIPASTTFKSNDTSTSPGFLYVLDVAYVMVGGVNIITLRALDAGLDSQLEIGDELTATAPLALIDSLVEVTAVAIPPLAGETLEVYRRKVLDAYRLEPQGGAGADYRLWSFDVQGVLQAYPYATTGASNEVDLFIEATITDSIDLKGTPSPTMLAAVQSAIEDPTVDRPSRKPLTVFAVNYLPVSPKDVDIIIPGFVGLTPAIETEIAIAITTALTSVRPFVSSIDVLADKNDILDVNKITALIIEANPGSIFGGVTFEVDSVPVLTFTFSNGDTPFLNSITYV